MIDAATIERAGPVALPDLLRRFGGVEVASNGGPGQLASVFVRGSNANHVLVLVDGVRLNSATAGTTALENIPVEQIERIEVLRGPASSLYGADAIGGVIQVFTKSAPERGHARLAVGRWRSAELSGGVGRRFGATELSLDAGIASSRAFSATNAGLPSNFDPDDDGHRNRHLGVRLGHAWAPGHRLTLRGLASDGRTHYDDYGNTDAVTHQRLSTVALESRDRLADGWDSLLRVARGSDHRRDEAAFPFFFDTDQDQLTWQHDVALAGGQAAAGVEWRRERVASDTPFDRDERRTRALFASVAAGLGATLVQASLRRDDDSQFGGRTTGNLALGWRVTPAWRLAAGTGSAFKVPSFNDLYYPGFSNPGLRPETSRGSELSARWEQGPLHAGLTLFEQRFRDLIQYDFASSQPQNVARARNRGATLAAGWRGAAWQAAAEWTWQDPVDADTGARLPRRARHHGTASLDWTPGGAWTAGADVVVNGDRVDNTFAPTAPRLGAYTLVNLRLGLRLAPEWRLALLLNNATDERYELVQGYNTARRQWMLTLAYGGGR